MAGSPFSLQGFNPLQMLQQRVVDANGVPQGVPPSSPSQPPVAAPVETPPPAAMPTASPSGGSGSGSGFLGGIGGAIGRAMSGEGLFGGGQPEGEVDPITGMSPGMQRRQGNQSMMKIGLLLMAAGQRQSPDTKARILASLPGAIGDGNDVNNFARNRLEMAKLRLLEKQEAREAAGNAAYAAQYGQTATGAPAPADPTAAPTPAPGTPVSTSGPTPTVISPVAVPNTADGTPAGTPTEGPPVPVGPLPADPATPAPATPPAPAGTPPTAAPNEGFLREVPKPPATTPWKATAEQARSIMMQPKLSEKQALENKYREEWNSREAVTPKYLIPGTNQLAEDVYKGGTKQQTRVIGTLPETASEKVDADGNAIVTTYDAAGRPTKINRSRENPNRDARQLATENDERDMVIKGREGLLKARETHATALRTYDRMKTTEKEILEGKSFTGPLANLQQRAESAAIALGVKGADAETVKKIITTNMAEGDLKVAATEFAKANMGPVVSDRDLQSAIEMFSAMKTGTKYEIANALRRVRSNIRDNAIKFESDVQYHNDTASKSGFGKPLYQARGLDRDFSKEEPDPDIIPKDEAPAPTNAPAGQPASRTDPAPMPAGVPPLTDALKKKLSPQEQELWPYLSPEDREKMLKW